MRSSCAELLHTINFLKKGKSNFSTGNTNIINIVPDTNLNANNINDNNNNNINNNINDNNNNNINNNLEGIIVVSQADESGKKKSGKAADPNQLVNSEGHVNIQQGEINIKIKEDKNKNDEVIENNRNSINNVSKFKEVVIENTKGLINKNALIKPNINLKRRKTVIDLPKEKESPNAEEELSKLLNIYYLFSSQSIRK